MDIRKIQFEQNKDERGNLIALEENANIPFEIRRVYYMFDTSKDVIRGRHAHKSLEQVLICIHGSCKLRLDDGHDIENILLDKPNEGIYISNNMWREMYDFSEDAVLLVVASEPYDERDYIRDYKRFIEYVSDSSTGKEAPERGNG